MPALRFLAVVITTALALPFVHARTEIPDAAQPQLTAAADGRVWLVYGRIIDPPTAPATPATPSDHSAHAGHHAGQKKKGHQPPTRTGEIFVACSTDGGATFAPAIKVATLPKLMLGLRRGPRIAAHGDRLTVTVIAHELLAFSSRDASKTWSAPVAINDVPAAAREGLHDLAAAPDGRHFVTWLDLRNGKTELWGATSPDGGPTWSRNEPVYKSPDQSICECCHPCALFDADGNLAVMWRNSIAGARDMWMTTRPKGVAQFSPAHKLGDGTWKLNACPMDGGEIIALGRGEFGAVWQRNGEIFLTRPSGAEVRLGQGKQPVATQTSAGSPLFAWQQGPSLALTRSAPESPAAMHATDARFPSLIALAKSARPLLAYEQGPAKGPTRIVIEQL